MIKNNYCWISKNKIYAEIFDELLDEDLSMNNKDHNDKIKHYLEKKIINNKNLNISEQFESNDEIISDLILKITSMSTKTNLQGNTVLMFANPSEMYELFYMEDLTSKTDDIELNELASISNIHLQPVYGGCGIFKSTYSTGDIKSEFITKKDLADIFIQNYYHKGIMINTTGDLIEIEFTGEDPYKVIGTSFTQSNVTNVIGFSLIPYVEMGNTINHKATKILGREIKGRVFISLLCPTTNKKFWNIDIKTIDNIIKILDDSNLFNKIEKELEDYNKDINPFYLIKKNI